MQRARVSPNQSSRVHLISRWDGVYRPGAQRSACGQIPITDPERWGNGRWFWTEDQVDCARCLDWQSRRG